MKVPTTHHRRSFLKSSLLAGGGMMLGFNFFASCEQTDTAATAAGGAGPTPPEEWFTINAFLKIGENGVVTIMSPNPEGGQNVKTSMPMIVAEELDVDWANVIVEQAPLNTELYSRQFIGGSQAIRRSWDGLRRAGATARHLLRQAAATAWGVPIDKVTTDAGMLYDRESDRSASYGAFASAAAAVPLPAEVALKDPKDFRIIGTARRNVDGKKIVTGQPLFGMDTRREGMLYAMIVHPPAFGLQLKSVNDAAARAMPGIVDVFPIKVFKDDYQQQYFDTRTFNELVAVVGKSTWQVLQAKKALEATFEPIEASTETVSRFGQEQTVVIPAGLESTRDHLAAMAAMAAQPGEVRRKDGSPGAAFGQAAKIITASYTAPFLAHNCMEPMNFFAHVTADKAELIGPLQKPEYTEQALAARLGMPVENIDVQMTRLGGGYGRRSYAHWLIEAALISQRVAAPVQLIYTREDEMTAGIYRPAYRADYRAALDADNQLIAFHQKAGGLPESPLYANRFPAGAVDNYLAEDWTVPTNLTTGSFRAPRSNFMGAAEQSFLDEVAEAAGKDPIDFRLELLSKSPVGEDNDYDPARYAGVLELVREKSGWDQEPPAGVHRGVSAYFCHDSYVALVMDIAMKNDRPEVRRVCCAVDCGIVVNPDAATNLCEGAIVDALGNALYGELTFTDGVADKQNFDTYRMIRINEAPRQIDVHFVESDASPTGLGEPAFPPVFAALANALYRATGERHNHQPYLSGRG